MFSGKITAQSSAGGIVGYIPSYIHVTINQCRNTAEIISIMHCAGIAGQIADATAVDVMNCFNMGNIQVLTSNITYVSAGGILGAVASVQEKVEIFNCYNTGNIDNTSSQTYCAAGGILGNVNSIGEKVLIANCYNMGKTTAKYQYITNFSGGILGGFWYNQYETDIKHCYYDETDSERSVGGSKIEYAQSLSQAQMRGQEGIQDGNSNSKTLLELLNRYIENNPDGLDTTKWTKWIQNQEGYPILDI